MLNSFYVYSLRIHHKVRYDEESCIVFVGGHQMVLLLVARRIVALLPLPRRFLLPFPCTLGVRAESMAHRRCLMGRQRRVATLATPSNWSSEESSGMNSSGRICLQDFYVILFYVISFHFSLYRVP